MDSVLDGFRHHCPTGSNTNGFFTRTHTWTVYGSMSCVLYLHYRAFLPDASGAALHRTHSRCAIPFTHYTHTPVSHSFPTPHAHTDRFCFSAVLRRITQRFFRLTPHSVTASCWTCVGLCGLYTSALWLGLQFYMSAVRFLLWFFSILFTHTPGMDAIAVRTVPPCSPHLNYYTHIALLDHIFYKHIMFHPLPMQLPWTPHHTFLTYYTHTLSLGFFHMLCVLCSCYTGPSSPSIQFGMLCQLFIDIHGVPIVDLGTLALPSPYSYLLCNHVAPLDFNRTVKRIFFGTLRTHALRLGYAVTSLNTWTATVVAEHVLPHLCDIGPVLQHVKQARTLHNATVRWFLVRAPAAGSALLLFPTFRPTYPGFAGLAVAPHRYAGGTTMTAHHFSLRFTHAPLCRRFFLCCASRFHDAENILMNNVFTMVPTDARHTHSRLR